MLVIGCMFVLRLKLPSARKKAYSVGVGGSLRLVGGGVGIGGCVLVIECMYALRGGS
jgi:hypothetical protein